MKHDFFTHSHLLHQFLFLPHTPLTHGHSDPWRKSLMLSFRVHTVTILKTSCRLPPGARESTIHKDRKVGAILHHGPMDRLDMDNQREQSTLLDSGENRRGKKRTETLRGNMELFIPFSSITMLIMSRLDLKPVPGAYGHISLHVTLGYL